MATAVRPDRQLVAAWAQPVSGVDQRITLVCALTGLVASLSFWLVHRALIDDAYITLSYARNLAYDFHWGLIRQEPANSATSPLFVMLLGAVTAVVRNTVLALGIVVVGAYVTLAAWITRTAVTLRLPITSAVLAIALVVLNPLMLSVTGMETALLATLIAGLLYSVVHDRPVMFGVLAGLCLLARIDLVIFIVLLGISSRAVRRRALRAALVAGAVSGPWFLWSWLHFGSAIPDTFVIKTLQHGFGTYVFTNGPFFYLRRQGPGTVVSFFAAVAGTAVLAVWIVFRVASRRREDARLDPVVAVGLGGIAYYAAYSALDIAPYSWYYGPVVVALSIFLALLLPHMIGRVLGAGARRPGRLAANGFLGAVVLAQAAIVVGHGMPWKNDPVVGGNWTTATDYARVGRELRSVVGDATVVSPGEIGTLAYFCRCAIVDSFSDRGRLVPQVEFRIARAEPVLGFALGVNFRYLDRSQLPRPADYELVFGPGRARGPDNWNVFSPATGNMHLQLIPSPAGTTVVDALERAALPSIGSGHGLVLVAASASVDPDYRDALARALAARHVRVRLDPGNALPWVSHRRYHGEPVKRVLVLARGDDIDRLLTKPGMHVVAYSGAWSRRLDVEARITRLVAMVRAGQLTGPAFYDGVLAAQHSLGLDLAVIST